MPEPGPVVTVTCSGDVVGLIPVLLGFVPADSVVVVGLVGSSHRIGPVLRYDLRVPPDVAALEVVPSLAAHGSSALFVAVYADHDAVADAMPWTAVPEAFARVAGRAGIELHDAVLVRRGRWRSLHCSAVGCCPSEAGMACPPAGRPVPDPVARSATGVVGRAAAHAVASWRRRGPIWPLSWPVPRPPRCRPPASAFVRRPNGSVP